MAQSRASASQAPSPCPSVTPHCLILVEFSPTSKDVNFKKLPMCSHSQKPFRITIAITEPALSNTANDITGNDFSCSYQTFWPLSSLLWHNNLFFYPLSAVMGTGRVTNARLLGNLWKSVMNSSKVQLFIIPTHPSTICSEIWALVMDYSVTIATY